MSRCEQRACTRWLATRPGCQGASGRAGCACFKYVSWFSSLQFSVPFLRQQCNAIKALAVRADDVGSSRSGVGRGDGAAGIGPVRLSQIGRELQMIRAAAQREPGQRNCAAGATRRQDFRRVGARNADTENCSSIIRAAVLCRAIEIAIAAEQKR